jgi:aminoglycoside phosphotransferase (APT) family kinase protein
VESGEESAPDPYNGQVRPDLTIDELLPVAAELLQQPLRDWHQPAAGADHLIVIAATDSGQKVVLKAGSEANVDADVLRRLEGTGAPVPRLLGCKQLDSPKRGYYLAVMSFVEGALLADVGAPHRYLAPLISAMRRVHEVTTTQAAGPVLTVAGGSTRSWTDYLLDVLTGADPEFDWSAIARSPWVDAAVLRAALDLARERVKTLPPLPRLSLLHGDLNPYNLFVHGERIAGIIDWSYARFGDPLFDFARLRMNPFVRANPEAIGLYFSLLGLGADGLAREQTYYLFNLVEYVNWYVLDERPEGVRSLMGLLSRILSTS